MSKFVLRDAYIAINGTAVSDHANSVQLTDTADEIEVTSFGPAMYKEYAQGMHDCTVTCTFFSDFAAGAINSILQPLYSGGGTFAVEIRPSSAARSATNPSALMTGRLYEYSGMSGAVGAAATFDANFRNAGTAGLSWATS